MNGSQMLEKLSSKHFIYYHEYTGGHETIDAFCAYAALPHRSLR
jgi:hypothetical protein